MVEKIEINGNLLAIIIRANDRSDSIEFITPNNLSFQLGLMFRNPSTPVKLHQHKARTRVIEATLEFLLVQDGQCILKIYSEEFVDYFREVELNTGDSALLISGKHSIKFVKPTHLLEVKQGPYSREDDKILLE
jgi:hypothetical protein